jgi:hypothetical protein
LGGFEDLGVSSAVTELISYAEFHFSSILPS